MIDGNRQNRPIDNEYNCQLHGALPLAKRLRFIVYEGSKYPQEYQVAGLRGFKISTCLQLSYYPHVVKLCYYKIRI